MRIDSRSLALLNALVELDVNTALPLLPEADRNMQDERGWSLIQMMVNHLHGDGAAGQRLLLELLDLGFNVQAKIQGGGCPIRLCILNRHFH